MSDSLREALVELVEAVVVEVNEKGAGGFLLARLTDARRALADTQPAPSLKERPEPALTDEQIEQIAYTATGASLEHMVRLIAQLSDAETNGDALGLLAQFRRSERIEAIRSALSHRRTRLESITGMHDAAPAPCSDPLPVYYGPAEVASPPASPSVAEEPGPT